MTPSDQTRLETQLQPLQLRHFKTHYQAAADKAAEQQCSHVDYLAQLADGATALRESRSIERRVMNARFPVLKTLEDFQWSWPGRSTGRRSRTCSASPSSPPTPTSC
jgi:DNA replication protein DnaC